MCRAPTALALLLLALPAAAGVRARREPAQAPPDPPAPRAPAAGVSAAQEAVYSAVLGDVAGVRAVFECRPSRLAGPEFALTLFLPQGPEPRREGGPPVRIAADDAGFDVQLTRLGTVSNLAVHRWAALAADAPGAARGLARALAAGGALELRDAETGAAEAFRYTPEQGGAAAEVLRRCNPAAVQARRDASELTATPALVALERNLARKCRDGAGDERATGDACDGRQEYADRLNALGMCFGRRGEAPQAMAWHRCGPTSFK